LRNSSIKRRHLPLALTRWRILVAANASRYRSVVYSAADNRRAQTTSSPPKVHQMRHGIQARGECERDNYRCSVCFIG
jgi:hypothetical protein